MITLEDVKAVTRKKIDELCSAPKPDEQAIKIMGHFIKILDWGDRTLPKMPKSTVVSTLFYIGYDFNELDRIYDELLQDAQKKYTLVPPEIVKVIRENEKES